MSRLGARHPSTQLTTHPIEVGLVSPLAPPQTERSDLLRWIHSGFEARPRTGVFFGSYLRSHMCMLARGKELSSECCAWGETEHVDLAPDVEVGKTLEHWHTKS